MNIAKSFMRMVPVLALGASIGCMQGKSNWQKFVEKTNTMIVDAGKKYGCVGRGEGEIEIDSMMGGYIAGEIAKNNAYTDYSLRCISPQAYNLKIDKENGTISGVMANGSLLKIRIFDCGRQDDFDPIGEKYYSAAAVCGREN